MKTLQLSSEQAKSLHSTASKDMKELLEANFPKLITGLVDDWRDLVKIDGFCYDKFDRIATHIGVNSNNGTRHLHPAQEDVESCIALAQLQQIILRTGDGVSYEEWGDNKINKFVISRFKNKAVKGCFYNTFYELAFKTESICLDFFDKHINLINTYLKIK